MTGQGGFAIAGADVYTWEWVLPVLVAAADRRRGRARRPAGVPALEPGPGAPPGADHDRGLGDRRRPGDRPLSEVRSRPGRRRQRRQPDVARLDRAARIDLQVWNIDYSLARLVMLALGVAVGIGLWLWLYRTRTGNGDPRRRRRPADDLGARAQHPEDVRDRLRRRLGARGVRRASSGRSQGNVASGQDGQWLLNSLVVVIVGGMGSLLGAAAGRAALRARAHVLRRRTCRRPATTAARSTRSCSRSS